MKQRISAASAGNRLRRVLPVLALCAMVFFFTACGAKYADSEYLGTWKATTATMSSISLDVSKTIGEFSITLEKDGSVRATIGKDKEKGKWEETENGFKLKDSSSEMDFTKTEKGNAKVEYQGMTLVFEQQ